MAQMQHVTDVAANMLPHTTASGIFRLAWRGTCMSLFLYQALHAPSLQPVACLRSPPATSQPRSRWLLCRRRTPGASFSSGKVEMECPFSPDTFSLVRNRLALALSRESTHTVRPNKLWLGTARRRKPASVERLQPYRVVCSLRDVLTHGLAGVPVAGLSEAARGQ